MIEARDLGKKFSRRTGTAPKYSTLRETLTNGARNLLKPGIRKPADEDFWALRDVNFSIDQGEVVGIIGRNGAGKSTLLKVLSQITTPTKGEVSMNGRVGSLLEVGTGFHPELSGRENIYMNGAILGMGQQEIRRKFDEIVEFSGVGDFIDMPVKRYSSGMHMRLAFAVAAHLEPEIMIIDEVLAVGDAEFQKKCLGKMQDVSRSGRTVLFVSHNINAVQQLCNRILWLDKGTLRADSHDVRATTLDYLASSASATAALWTNTGNEFASLDCMPLQFFVGDENGNVIKGPVANNEQHYVYIDIDIKNLHSALTLGYALYTADGALLYWCFHKDTEESGWPALKEGRQTIRGEIPRRLLNEGVYNVELIGSLHFIQWFFQPGVSSPAIQFEIQGGISDSPLWINKRNDGILAPIIPWEIAKQ